MDRVFPKIEDILALNKVTREKILSLMTTKYIHKIVDAIFNVPNF
jgi:hypothetical protein